jgi:hypothetical protein
MEIGNTPISLKGPKWKSQTPNSISFSLVSLSILSLSQLSHSLATLRVIRMEIANTQFLLFLNSPISLSLSFSTLKFEECKLQIHNFISLSTLSLSLPVFLSFATLSVPTMETANTQFHLSLSLSRLLHSKVPRMEIANTQFHFFLPLSQISRSLFVSHLLHSMFQQSKLQILNFTSLSLSLSLSLLLATLKGSNNGNCEHPISFLSLSLSFATLNVPTIETANTQFHLFFTLNSPSLSLSPTCYTQSFQQWKLQIPNFKK